MSLPKTLLVAIAAVALASGAYYLPQRRAASHHVDGQPHPDSLVAGLQVDPFPLRAFPGWEIAWADLSLDPERSPGEVARLMVNLRETGGVARRDVVFSVFENAEHAARNFRDTTADDHPEMTPAQRREVLATVYRPVGLEARCIRPRGRIANCHARASRTVVFVVFLDGGEEVAKTTDLIRALTTHVSNVGATVGRE